MCPPINWCAAELPGTARAVCVEYNTQKVSLDAILFAYFQVIDPTVKNRQGNDRGSQYQTGVYFADEASQKTVERIAEIESQRHDNFVVEIGPLERFYDAEEYHQDYLDKNPSGYCHISREEIATISKMIFDPAVYQRPADEKIKAMLTEEQYRVTQKAATESALPKRVLELSRPRYLCGYRNRRAAVLLQRQV